MTPTPARYFGEQVRSTRKRKEWTQDDLAARLAQLGTPIHPTAITKIEKGKRSVSIDEAIAIAAALDVSPLAVLLPRDDKALVAIAPAASPLRGEDVRAWIEGLLPITTIKSVDREDGLLETRTIDDQPLTEGEVAQRRRFYESEVSADLWRIRQIPGLAHLRQLVHHYERDRDRDADPEILWSYLNSLEYEIQRQREQIQQLNAARRSEN